MLGLLSLLDALACYGLELDIAVTEYFKGIKMRAFYKVDELTIKAYDMVDDWRLIDSNGKEYWRSKWTDEYASLCAAFFLMVEENGYCFKESRLTLCERG